MTEEERIRVADPVSMTKTLFGKYRPKLYAFLNRFLRDGTVEALVDAEVLDPEIGRENCVFHGVIYRRIDRANFLADVEVELRLRTAEGPAAWRGILALWGCFGEELFLVAEDLAERVDREGYDLLDKYLIPYYNNKKMDQVAEEIWERYLPGSLADPAKRRAAALARQMGLRIQYLPVLGHEGTDGILFFATGELACAAVPGDPETAAWRELHLEHPERRLIPAGTIVVNTGRVRREDADFGIYHECIHNELHYLFFRLQQMGSTDAGQMRTKEIAAEDWAERDDPVGIMESQATRGAYGLWMPAGWVRQIIAEESEKAGPCRHDGEKYEQVGKALADRLEVFHIHARARMVQLGIWQARGSLNYVGRRLIEPFAFDREAWMDNRNTYVVDERDVGRMLQNNPEFHALMARRKYVWADGRVVRNDPEFVRKEGDRLLLTEKANRHVNGCCLRFVRGYRQQGPGRYTYGRMYFDADYLRQTEFYLSDKMNGGQTDEITAMKKFKEEFPAEFRAAVALLRRKNGMNLARLAEELNMDDSTLRRWLEDPTKYRNEDFLTILALIFKLPDWISVLLFRRAHFQLDEEDPRHCAIRHILRAQSEDGIEAANRYLERNHLAPLSVTGGR